MAKGKPFPVQFAGTKGLISCDEAFQSNETVLWHSYLRHARNNRNTVTVTCLCREVNEDMQDLRLKVSHSENTDRYWLSAWPYEGNRHDDMCRFYSIWADKRQAGIYDAGVVQLGTDGMFRIRLPTGLQKVVPESADDKDKLGAEKNTTPGKRRQAMRLLGLLHFMWEQAGINVWHPAFERKKPRGSSWMGHRLDAVSARIRVGRTVLAEVMLIPGRNDCRHRNRNFQKLRAATKNKKRMILVSQLASWTEAAEQRFYTTLPLGLFAGFPELDVPEDVRGRCERSYGRELGHWRNGARVMVIAETEPPVTSFSKENGKIRPSTRSEVIDVALMVVSPRYIPLDSAYEGVIEDKLWSEHRAFRKPLRYDGEEEVFPDFILTDVRGEGFIPLEVFGMNTREYLDRKALKQAYYNKAFGEGNWWGWDATEFEAELNIPNFPAKQNGRG